MVFQVLNKLKWTGKIGEAKIIILHRGAPENKKTVYGKNIKELKKSYFIYKNKEETFIPLHRVLEVWVKNRLVWKKS
ncbi:MAG: hypothetical protein DRP13_02990 [Candidatus Aenigmatarchaeota archaeon]|nr:MAG: hypothetical protein DRP18_01260 [Candidatus Aenigmarchaeota archaeon]RLJ07884.1 MAG: hypothetical protein DRP16_02565 [Candidatus Aenigmarchaeota archaeon]RLJ08016.1 MAG: hypothetical protein DRP13_02990 [Candidatus Aenigmarchaeota archaeon]